MLLVWALRVAAVMLFAVLPALTKGGLLYALTAGLIFSVVTEAVTCASNIPSIKYQGAGATIETVYVTIICNLIGAAGGYGLAVYILA